MRVRPARQYAPPADAECAVAKLRALVSSPGQNRVHVVHPVFTSATRAEMDHKALHPGGKDHNFRPTHEDRFIAFVYQPNLPLAFTCEAENVVSRVAPR